MAKWLAFLIESGYVTLSDNRSLLVHSTPPPPYPQNPGEVVFFLSMVLAFNLVWASARYQKSLTI